MARRPDDLDDGATVVLIEDEFSVLSEDDRARLTDEWLASLRTVEPRHLNVTGAELLEEARREDG